MNDIQRFAIIFAYGMAMYFMGRADVRRELVEVLTRSAPKEPEREVNPKFVHGP